MLDEHEITEEICSIRCSSSPKRLNNDDQHNMSRCSKKGIGQPVLAMSLLSHINLAYPFSGFCIGALVGLTGVGGGSLMTPVLVLLFGIHPATAVGTDLLYASITKSGGTIVHSINKSVDWGIVARLAGGSIPGAAMTLFILNSLGAATQRTGSIISIILGIVLILTALSLFFHRHILDFASNRLGEISPQRAALLTVVTGTILGILVSMSSVGAGALGVTALICLYPKLPFVQDRRLRYRP